MKKAILGVFLLTVMTAMLSLNLVSAWQMTGHLDMNTDPGKQICQKIYLATSDYAGDIKVRDKWAWSFNETANLNRFTATPTDLGMVMTYNPVIKDFVNKTYFDVCISANYSGMYKGAIIFTPTYSNPTCQNCVSQVVEYGTWIYVNVSGNVMKPQQVAQIVQPAVIPQLIPVTTTSPSSAVLPTTQPAVTSPTIKTSPTVAKVSPSVVYSRIGHGHYYYCKTVGKSKTCSNRPFPGQSR